MEKKCIICDKPFNAKRSTAKFCSPTCRKAYSRQIDDDVTLNDTLKNNVTDEWLNCAETKTQAEIEEHFTLANFPCRARYYGSGGGGSGSLSPYRTDDPRHKAYTLN